MSKALKVLLALAGGLVLAVGLTVAFFAHRLRPDVETAAPLPKVTLTELSSGAEYDLAALRGEVVVLDFWAST